MPGQRDQADEVLDFWFVQSRPRQWFAKDQALRNSDDVHCGAQTCQPVLRFCAQSLIAC